MPTSIGIIGLVDEATGYQGIRAKRALATILEEFIAEELQPWTKTFPYEFYEEIFRLKGWPGPDGVKRPSVIGHYTNDIVYARLAPGVLDELKQMICVFCGVFFMRCAPGVSLFRGWWPVDSRSVHAAPRSDL